MSKLKTNMFGEIVDGVPDPDRVKLGKRNRRKGTDYERKVARLLARYTGLRWSRVPYSGASYIAGDVTCLDFNYPFVFELKNRGDVSLTKVFRNPQSIQPYVNEDQILIFNNEGQDIAVVPFHKTFGLFKYEGRTPANHFVVTIAGIVYMGMDLKDLGGILKEIYDGRER